MAKLSKHNCKVLGDLATLPLSDTSESIHFPKSW